MITLWIYMQDGRTYSYKVKDVQKAREHAHRIINYGWRNLEGEEMCYYPIHQILKVKFNVVDKDKLMTEYEAQ